MRASTGRPNYYIRDAVRDSLRYGWHTLPMIAAYVLVVATTFLWFEPAPVASFYRWADKIVVRPGETVTITAHVVRNKANCESTVTRVWHDSENVHLAEIIFEMPALDAGLEAFARPAIVPPSARPGALWLNSVVEFRCNPVQRAFGGTRFVMPDLKFIVEG